MAASAATESSSPGLCPNYAVICSFLERYGALLDLPELTFPQLERYLRDTSSSEAVPKLLVDLHVKLLRKIGKSVSADRWEKYLLKVCQELNPTWAWELEQNGYKDLSTECKTGLLKYLCECQFDDNVKFKTAINEEDPDNMRLQPIGRDKDGQMYWFQLDQSDNVRLYIEEQDDLDGSSWKCIVKDRNDLAEVVALLKTQIDPALLKRDEEMKAAAEEGKEKTDGEVKKIEDSSDEDIKDKAAGQVSPKTENNEKATENNEKATENNEKATENNEKATENNEKATENNEKATEKDFKSETSLNGVIEEKPEAELNSEKPASDLSIITKVQNIKEEPMEVSDTKSSNTATSEPASEVSCLSVKAEKGDEAKKTEEIQQALKNDQQAKIPLKKRGMKFSEDFEKHSGIIVQNPSVSHLKEAPKADSTLDQSKKAQSVNDHVNGEVASAKSHLIESLKDAASCSNHKEQEPMKATSATKDSCTEDKALKETDKTLATGESEKDALKEVKSKDLEERTASVDASKSSKAEETKTKQTERSEDKEKATCEANVEKSDKSAEKEKQGVIKTSDKDHAKKSAESEKTASTSVVKNTEKLKESDNAESKEATKSLKKAEISDKSDSVESPVIKKLDKSCKLGEKQDKDEEKKQQKASETDTKKPEDVKKAVNCEDVPMHDVSKISDSVEVEAVAVKPDVTKPQEDDKTEINSVASKEKKGDTSEGKDKPCSDVEKINVPKETERMDKDKGKMSEEQAKKMEAECPSSGSKKDADLEKRKDTEIKNKKDTDLEKTTDSAQKKDKEMKMDTDMENRKETGMQKDTESENKKDTDVEKRKDTDLGKRKDTDLEKRKETDLEKRKETDLEKREDTDLGKRKETDTDKKKDTDLGKRKDTDLEKRKDTDLEKKKETDLEKRKDTDLEKRKETESAKKKETDLERRKNTDLEKKKETDLEKRKDTDLEKKKVTDLEKRKDTDLEKRKDTDLEKRKDTESVKKMHPGNKKDIELKKKETDTDKKKDTDLGKRKDTDLEKRKDTDSGKTPETENKKGSESKKKETDTDNKNKTDSANKTETGKKKDTEAENKNDSKSSTDTEKASDPSKEPDAEKPAEEEGKSKSDEDEDDEEATKKVANGRGTPASRRRSKRPAHRRKAVLQRAERQDSESDTNTGMSLRRSPRISRPTTKAVEIQEKKPEKSAPPADKSDDDEKGEKEKDEDEEEEEEKAVQKKPREKKPEQEGQTKPKGRKRRRVRWSNTRTRRKKKGSEDEEENSEEESSAEEETEEEDDSDEDYKVERRKRRRNRNRERRESDSSTSSDDDLPPNDDPCKHCGLPSQPELILLCDSCDSGYHTACLRPPLMIIPDGEWFCSPCQHKLLYEKLEEQLLNLDVALKKKERAERRKERLIYVGISLENIITPGVSTVEEEKPEIIIKEKKEAKKSKSWGRRSTRTKKSISYRFDEFDEAIEEAIEEDIREAEGGGAGRGKDMANITGLRGKDMSVILQADEGKENGETPQPPAGPRRKKRRRLNDLDSDSTVDEEESEDEFRISESSEEEFVASENGSEAESDSSSGKKRTSKCRKPPTRRRSARKRRRPKGYSDDEEEETDEEDEDEMATEGSSEYSDSDLDMSRRRSRRSKKAQVNYRETSESEGSQAETNRAKMKPRRRMNSSSSEASSSKDSEEESKEPRRKRRGASSSEEEEEKDSKQKHRRIALKRRRASEDDESDDDSDASSSEEDRPVRKRVNRIDSDDDEEEEEEKEEKEEKEDKEEEEKPKEKKADEETKGTVDSTPVDLPPTNGQNAIKTIVTPTEAPKNITAGAIVAPNGQEVAPQEEDEDDLLGVTDLVDYVCNSEDL